MREYFHPPLPSLFIAGKPQWSSAGCVNRTIHRAYKTELNPNETQRLQFQRHAGAARFAYNWGLERVKSAYSNGSRVPSAMDLHKELNGLKETKLATG